MDELLAHSQWIGRLARRLTADSSTADDLVQDTWLEAVARPPRNRGALRAWLARVVTNAARDERRSADRRRRREQVHLETPEAGQVPATDELAERLETHRVLVEELTRISEPYRTTLLLVYYEGLGPSAISQAHGVPAGTVRWRLKHGLDALRARVQARLGPDAMGGLVALSVLGRQRPEATEWGSE